MNSIFYITNWEETYGRAYIKTGYIKWIPT